MYTYPSLLLPAVACLIKASCVVISVIIKLHNVTCMFTFGNCSFAMLPWEVCESCMSHSSLALYDCRLFERCLRNLCRCFTVIVPTDANGRHVCLCSLMARYAVQQHPARHAQCVAQLPSVSAIKGLNRPFHTIPSHTSWQDSLQWTCSTLGSLLQ